MPSTLSHKHESSISASQQQDAEKRLVQTEMYNYQNRSETYEEGVPLEDLDEEVRSDEVQPAIEIRANRKWRSKYTAMR